VVIDTGPTETRQNQPLFRVDHGVRPKNNLTEPALLEMSGNATYQDFGIKFDDNSVAPRRPRHSIGQMDRVP
jgi:hypothetical protein